MRKLSLIPLLFLPGLAQAVICKMIGPDGVVTYTDLPVEECRNPVSLPDYSRYSPRPVQETAPAAAERAPQGAPAFEGYRSMKIVQPEPLGVVRSNEGKVPVSIDLEPELQDGHLIVLYVDGERVRGRFAGPDIELRGIERGTHTVRAEVVDSGGRRQLGADPVEFTLRKAALFEGREATSPNTPAN